MHRSKQMPGYKDIRIVRHFVPMTEEENRFLKQQLLSSYAFNLPIMCSG